MIIFILLGFLLIALLDFIPLIKYKQKKGAIIFGIIFVLTLTFVVIQELGIEIPSIILILDKTLEKIGLHY